MPAMVSLHGRWLIKSPMCGWQCHEHPLSITAQHMESAAPNGAGIAGETLLSKACPASSARPARPVLRLESSLTFASGGCAARARRATLALPLKACRARGFRFFCLTYLTLHGSVTVGDDVKTLSSATPPQRRKFMQVACRRARTVASVVVRAAPSRDFDGEVGVNLAGGHADDSDTNVLMRRR